MKKLLILLVAVLAFGLISCTKSKEERLNDSVSEAFKISMNDPSTFELVDAHINKTISVGERKKVMNEERLETLNKMYKDKDWMGASTDRVKKMINQTKTEIEFLKDKADDFEGVYYVRFTVRGSNSFGAIIKNTYSATVLNDEYLTVVHYASFKE